MSEMEKLLDSVAREATLRVVVSDNPEMDCGAVLKRRLLPLLLAGEDFCCGGGCHESKERWQLAKRQAMEGKT